jgi:hypothetical protein
LITGEVRDKKSGEAIIGAIKLTEK